MAPKKSGKKAGENVAWWVAAAAALPSDDFAQKVPIHVMLGEAIDAAKFFDKYWASEKDAKTNQVVRPGLETAGKNLPAVTGRELRELQEAGQQAQTAYLLSVSKKDGAGPDIARGEFVLGEITAALEWFFDDGVEDDNDAKLASLADAHKEDTSSADGLAAALTDYAALGAAHRKALDGLGGFDVALLDEAPRLATTLRERTTTSQPISTATRQALAHRNRLFTLLTQRIQLVRSAARFVFRNHPAILREVTSTYQRRRRAAARRAKQNPPTPA